MTRLQQSTFELHARQFQGRSTPSVLFFFLFEIFHVCSVNVCEVNSLFVEFRMAATMLTFFR